MIMFHNKQDPKNPEVEEPK